MYEKQKMPSGIPLRSKAAFYAKYEKLFKKGRRQPRLWATEETSWSRFSTPTHCCWHFLEIAIGLNIGKNFYRKKRAIGSFRVKKGMRCWQLLRSRFWLLTPLLRFHLRWRLSRAWLNPVLNAELAQGALLHLARCWLSWRSMRGHVHNCIRQSNHGSIKSAFLPPFRDFLIAKSTVEIGSRWNPISTVAHTSTYYHCLGNWKESKAHLTFFYLIDAK